MIEKRIEGKPPDERYDQRQQHTLPVLTKLRQWRGDKLKKVLPSSDRGQALAYLDRYWNGRVIQHPSTPIQELHHT
ncbi:MAG: transposase [Gammaproteobacteria bacterium]|nr:transposase [Gammaproteobacteria bacterium]